MFINYVPRAELIERGYNHLLGEEPGYGGHYITVWAPRQTGKTWVMRQVTRRLRKRDDFQVAIVAMQSAKYAKNDEAVLRLFVNELSHAFAVTYRKLRIGQS